MKSVMSNRFSQIPDVKLQRSRFNRSHGLKTTFNASYLVPVFVDEALPGDTFNLNMSCFGRIATPIVPIMDNIYLDSFFFAVPYRLVWDNWKRFNGEADPDPDSSTDYNIPVLDHTVEPCLSGFQAHSLDDYFGLPTLIAAIEKISSLHHRAYNLIYNEWFRDQNLQDSVQVDKDDGPDDGTDYVLLKRGKRHDYFTSCLPWPQKGDSVELPLGTSAPVVGDGDVGYINDGTAEEFQWQCENADAKMYASSAWTGATPIKFGKLVGGTDTGLETDLSSATAATINALRQAFQIQRLYERDARGGTRYIEILRSHFGVVSPDARLQRPEYLGGGRTVININPVTQTSQTATTPQGTMAAMGTVSASGHGFVKSFTEHCLIIGMVCCIADLTYQQGLNRMWSRQTRWDFYWPALANIGEQAVLNKEIYCKSDGNDDLVFGYQERYAEYRYKPSLITGKFRSNYAQTLEIWHQSIEFGALPVLNASFIVESVPLDRSVVAANEAHILFDSYFDLNCVRPMPTYSVPGLIDHF